jgi:hypothetical protein
MADCGFEIADLRSHIPHLISRILDTLDIVDHRVVIAHGLGLT